MADTTTDSAGNPIANAVGSIAGWWTNTFGAGKGLAEQSAALDAKIAAQQQADYAPGGRIYNQIADQNGGGITGANAADNAWATVQAHDAQMTADTAAIQDAITVAAQTGANDGLNNAKAAVNSTLSGLLGMVPASVWLLLGVGAFLYLGGFTWLKGILAKAKK